MAQHKFRVGQDVDYMPGKHAMNSSSRSFKIVRRLPLEQGELTYRIKSAVELFERVVRESEIAAITPASRALMAGNSRK